jgi:hypothetical protein
VPALVLKTAYVRFKPNQDLGTGFLLVSRTRQEILKMLWTIISILLVLWLVGMISGALGGIIHLLLIAALVAIVVSALAGRRTV